MYANSLGLLIASGILAAIVDARRILQIQAATSQVTSARGDDVSKPVTADDPPNAPANTPAYPRTKEERSGINATSVSAGAVPAIGGDFQEVPQPSLNNCTELGSLQIGEDDLGASLLLVCQHWDTKAWGPFPVRSTHDAEALLSAVVSPGGLHDQVKELRTQRTNSTEFCWKGNALRPSQTPTGHHCPEVFNNFFAAEIAKKTQPTRRGLLNGTLTCQKSCADICGSTPLLHDDSASGTCRCLDSSSDGGIVELTLSSTVDPQPEGCDAVRQGKCYGQCPPNFKPAFLVGQVFPVCNVACRNTKLRSDCGLGCASSAVHCGAKIVNQIDEIVRSIAHGSALLTGQLEITATADALVGVVEFAESVVSKMKESVMEGLSGVQQKRQAAGLMASLLHVLGGADIRQAVVDVSSGSDALRGKYSQFASLFGNFLHEVSETKIAPAKDIGHFFFGPRYIDHRPGQQPFEGIHVAGMRGRRRSAAGRASHR